MTGSNKTRGIRNNNPGNIRWGDDWKGLVPQAQRTVKSFCQFTGPRIWYPRDDYYSAQLSA